MTDLQVLLWLPDPLGAEQQPSGSSSALPGVVLVAMCTYLLNQKRAHPGAGTAAPAGQLLRVLPAAFCFHQRQKDTHRFEMCKSMRKGLFLS